VSRKTEAETDQRGGKKRGK
jgi:hypothetical protein